MTTRPLPAGYAIRQARLEEVPLLPDIEERAGALFLTSPHPEVTTHSNGTPQMFRAHITQGVCFVVVDTDDSIVGFATCGVLDQALHLYELAVVSEHGGKGLGRALVEDVCREAAARGLGAVTLSTFTDVAWNAPFYARAGFHPLSEDALSPALHLVQKHEQDIGLTNRCIMRRDIE